MDPGEEGSGKNPREDRQEERIEREEREGCRRRRGSYHNRLSDRERCEHGGHLPLLIAQREKSSRKSQSRLRAGEIGRQRKVRGTCRTRKNPHQIQETPPRPPRQHEAQKPQKNQDHINRKPDNRHPTMVGGTCLQYTKHPHQIQETPPDPETPDPTTSRQRDETPAAENPNHLDTPEKETRHSPRHTRSRVKARPKRKRDFIRG